MELIDKDGSPAAPKLFALWNPPLCTKTVSALWCFQIHLFILYIFCKWAVLHYFAGHLSDKF